MSTNGHRLALSIMFVNIYISLRNFNTWAITFEFQAAFGMMYTLFGPHEASSDLNSFKVKGEVTKQITLISQIIH